MRGHGPCEYKGYTVIRESNSGLGWRRKVERSTAARVCDPGGRMDETGGGPILASAPW